MIRLYAPKQLKLFIEQHAKAKLRDLAHRSAMIQRSFAVPIDGEKSLQNFHENRDPNKLFYKLNQITLLRNFPDPLGKYKAYAVYMVEETTEIIHEMQYVDDPDDYLDIDNPYRGFVGSETKSSQSEQSTEDTENE